jgi:hypothetical protein
VFEHQPYPYGGGASDSAFYNNFGDPYWQRLADEVVLSQAAVIDHISFFGFYNLDNPPEFETMRIRWYGARINGLPDEAQDLYEQSIDNPSRVGTGHLIAPEGQQVYLYGAKLSAPVGLDANTLYWLEIAQIGEFDTTWRWEFSLTDQNGQAYINPATHDWRHTTGITADTAFQLIGTPEPSSGLFLLCTIGFALARRAPRNMPGGARIRPFVLAAIVIFAYCDGVSATIIVDQPPTYLGGYGSDTDFLNGFGDPVWQRVADNVRLSQDAIVRSLRFYAFCGGDEQNHEPPVGSETIRVRVYGSRTVDGLPNEFDIRFEQSYSDLSRAATGRTIAVQGRPAEHLYQADLESGVSLLSNTTYWLEIAQIGDPDSTFRWETGFGAITGHAFVNSIVADWEASSGSFAFQLSTIPEPSTGICVILALGFVFARRTPRSMPGAASKRRVVSLTRVGSSASAGAG